MTYYTVWQKDSNSNLSGRYQHRTLWWLQTLAELDTKSKKCSFYFIPVIHARKQSYRRPWVFRHLPRFPLHSSILLWFAFVHPCSGQAGRSESSSTSAGHSGLLHMATPVIRHYRPFSPAQWAFLPLLSNLMKPNRLQNSRKSLARFHNDLIILCSYKFSFSFKKKKN